jgi:hypothetical protein
MGSTQSNEIKIDPKISDISSPSTVTESSRSSTSTNEVYPTPKGDEYDAIDKIAAELPNIIDDESRQQVEDYKQACDNGKGPMVRIVDVYLARNYHQTFSELKLTKKRLHLKKFVSLYVLGSMLCDRRIRIII